MRDEQNIRDLLTQHQGESRTEILRDITETLIDSSLSVIESDCMSVQDWESNVGRLSEDERENLSESFVVVSREGLRSLVSLLVRDSMGMTHNFDEIREIVGQVPESERPEFPDLSSLNTKERGFVRRATRELCSTDCPRFCQGDCPFDRVEDCPRYKQ